MDKLDINLKRLLCMLLVCAITISSLVLIPENASALQDGDWTYTISGSDATVTGYTGVGGDLIIPPTLGGYDVVEIGFKAFFYNTNITSIIIPDGVTTIGDYAIFRCSVLATVTIPNSVNTIGVFALSNNYVLTSANIPNNITTIEQGLFQSCELISNIIIPDSVTTIGDFAFADCYGLTSITIPSGVIGIGNSSFSRCTQLTNIVFQGNIAPLSVGTSWIYNTPVGIRGHAYATSNFPTPGNVWNNLTMGTVIPVPWVPTYNTSTILTCVMDDNTTYNFETFPSISELNATHDLYTVEFDTWASVNSVNITGETTWKYLSSTPWCSSVVEYSPYLNLTGVVPSVTYRIYFAVPIARTCSVHFSVWIASTGEGVPFETFHLRYCPGTTYNASTASDLAAADVSLDYGKNWTSAVLDYFDNVITTQPFTTMGKENYVSIPIDVHSVKFFNQQDDFVKVRIYYNGSGVPITYFTAPMEPVERFLRTGNYTFVLTFYDNATALATQYWNMTVDDAEFLMLEGNTIQRVITDVEGVYSLQQIITTMITPDVVFIGEDLPMVPNDAFDSGIELVHPWSVVHGWANGTEFTNETLFYYSYYTSRKYYEVTLNVTNADGVDWTNVTWFIGFPENRSIDYSTVRVYDLNNDCYLVAGLHYDMTLTGIRMKWANFNDTLSRSLRISMYDANASSGGGLAIAIASSYTPSQYDGESYYMANARWTNSFSYAYDGQLQVRLTFDGYEDIDPSSVIIYDRNTGRQLADGEFSVGGGMIVISDINAAIGTVYSVDIYFKLDLSESSSLSMTTPFLGCPLWLWFLGALVASILALVVVDGRFIRSGRGWKKVKVNDTVVALIIVVCAIFLILWYFMTVGVV